jgi:hypothetical protein
VKISNILDIRSLEFVDGLVIISYSKDVGTIRTHAKNGVHEPHLCFVGILKFINEDKLVLLGQVGLYRIISFDEFNSTEDHVIEINISTFFQFFLVGQVDVRERLLFFEFLSLFEYFFSIRELRGPVIFPSGEEFGAPISCIGIPCIIK